MNERQRKVLLRCTKPEVGPVSTAVIAGELKVSEKTIRNDLKIIDDWLSRNRFGPIDRKPNQGILAIISESQRQDIEAALNDPSSGLSDVTSRLLANLSRLISLVTVPIRTKILYMKTWEGYYIFDIVAEVVHKDELLASYLFTDDEDVTIVFMLVDDDFRAALAEAANKEEIYALMAQIAV